MRYQTTRLNAALHSELHFKKRENRALASQLCWVRARASTGRREESKGFGREWHCERGTFQGVDSCTRNPVVYVVCCFWLADVAWDCPCELSRCTWLWGNGCSGQKVSPGKPVAPTGCLTLRNGRYRLTGCSGQKVSRERPFLNVKRQH
jgi:hypothetical protein